MRNTLFLIILSSFFVFTMLHADSPAWHHPDAPVRLRVELPVRPHSQFLVPVPEEWASSYRGALAFTDQGTPLPASPIMVGDNLQAIAVNAYGHFAVKPPPAPGQLTQPPAKPGISIYLLPEVTDLAKPHDGLRAVTVQRQIRSLTTRAFTASEIMRLFSTAGRRRNRPLTALVDNISQLPDRDNWRHFPEGRHATAMLHWQTNWLLTEAKSIAFGADQTHVAWCILVNGEVAASWQEGTPRPGGGAFGTALQLPAGIHTIQMLVVQKPDEQIPACLVRDADSESAGSALTGLLPAKRPEWLGADLREQPNSSLHTIMAPDATYCFLATDVSITAYTAMPDEDKVKRNYFDRQGQELTCNEDKLLLSPGGQVPAIKLSGDSLQLTFPGSQHWQAGTIHSGRLRFVDLPAVLPHNATLPLKVSCSWQNVLPKAIQQNMTMKIMQTDKDNRELATTWTSIPHDDATAPLDIQLAPNCHQITIACGLPHLAALSPLTLKLLHPSDSLAGLTVRGNGVFQHEQRVLLHCELLPAAPRAEAKMSPATAAHLILLDDFMALATAPGADLLPEAVIANALQGKNSTPLTSRVMSANTPGTTPRLSLWQSLPAAQHLRPDIAVIAVGALPLADGLTALDWSAHLLFAAQSCLAADIKPMLVALPDLPGIDAATSRLAALYTKEIGLALGVPVLDLHSERKIGQQNRQSWFAAGATAPAMANNEIRQWLAEATAQALQPYLKK